MAIFTSLAVAGGILYAGTRIYKKRQQSLTNIWMVNPGAKEKSIRKFDNIRAYFEDKRQQQLEELSAAPIERNPAEPESNRRLAVATINLGVAIGGLLFYTPLSLITLPLLGYLSWPIFQDAYRSIRGEHKVGLSVLDAIFLSGTLMARLFVAVSIGAWLIELGNNLLLRTEHRSRQKLTHTFGQQPRHIWVLHGELEIKIPFENLMVDDIVVIQAGQIIPIDGAIVKGEAIVDQHLLTGESQPVEKMVGDQVMASTTMIAGQIQVKVEKTGEETVVAELGKILHNTAEFTELLQSQGIKLAEQAVIPTLALSAVSWPIVGPIGSLTLLTASFGYNLRVVAPLSMLTFLQITSQQGILIKDGRSLEQLSKIDTIIFDKTGTLTVKQPTVGKIYTCNGFSKDQILQYAATAEQKQTHPIAKAILLAAKEQEKTIIKVEDSQYDIGYGISVKLDNHYVRVGSKRFVSSQNIIIPDDIKKIQDYCYESGYSLVYIVIDNELGGAIELRPTLRSETKNVIDTMKQLGMDIYIISGDQEEPTKKLAQELGIDNYFAETLPENKANHIEQLQKEGRSVCFIGDGINDAIALKKANLSISLLGATTIATDTAQIVFMDESLSELPFLFELGEDFKNNMHRSFLSTVIPAAICVGGVFFLHFGVLTGIGLFNLGLISGIANGLLPKLKYKQ